MVSRVRWQHQSPTFFDEVFPFVTVFLGSFISMRDLSGSHNVTDYLLGPNGISGKTFHSNISVSLVGEYWYWNCRIAALGFGNRAILNTHLTVTVVRLMKPTAVGFISLTTVTVWDFARSYHKTWRRRNWNLLSLNTFDMHTSGATEWHVIVLHLNSIIEYKHMHQNTNLHLIIILSEMGWWFTLTNH